MGPGISKENPMLKLQTLLIKSRRTFRLAFVRKPQHLQDLFASEHEQAWILTPPLPSSEAYVVLETWQRRLSGGWRWIWLIYLRTSLNKLPEFRASVDRTASGEEGLLEKLEDLLRGRILTEQKVFRVLRQEGVWPSAISRTLDFAIDQGYVKQFPGFQSAPWGRKICSRCQSEENTLRPCLNCGRSQCLFCLSCATMGENRGCSTLLASPATCFRPSSIEVTLALDYTLTDAQRVASQELLEFGTKAKHKALVWAACGAGKTEVTFPLIQQVLRSGGEVLFAIPRQDIVREMAVRLKKAFPNSTVTAHYGGQPWQAPGQLVVATTHQVLHFYQRFQLAILDEVDAFPYQGNEMLQLALLRSLAPGGRFVEMTATPQSLHSYGQVITIPARYHGHPLPEPQVLLHTLPPWDTLQANDLPMFLLNQLQKDDPWLVFVPTIAAGIVLQRILTGALQRPVGLCHSKVENRIHTIEDFRKGNFDVLVTTSVLERGVNFKGVGVIVLYADHGIFSASALVQMAGRVGRSEESPGGNVIFIGSRRSEAMVKSCRLIRELNHEARKKGLLTHEATP